MTRLLAILLFVLTVLIAAAVKAQMPPTQFNYSLLDWRVATDGVTIRTNKGVLLIHANLQLWDAPNWYVVECSADLLAWTPLITNQTPDVMLPSVLIETKAEGTMFFRVEQRTNL